jgi:hypothetical protein
MATEVKPAQPALPPQLVLYQMALPLARPPRRRGGNLTTHRTDLPPLC